MKRHLQTADACLNAVPKAGWSETDWHTDAGFNEYDHDEVLIRHRPSFADPIAVKDFLAQTDSPNRAFQRIFQ